MGQLQLARGKLICPGQPSRVPFRTVNAQVPDLTASIALEMQALLLLHIGLLLHTNVHLHLASALLQLLAL